MRLIARHVDMSRCPVAVRDYMGQSFVSPGKNYVAYAIALFEAVLLCQVIDDEGYPSWRPLWLFDVVDPSLPPDWICGLFHEDPRLVLGPEFVARTHSQYSAMVELERTQVDRFWEYVETHAPHAANP